MGKTGTPVELCKKLRVSESQWYNILDDLKSMGFPIVYCKRSKTYFYREFCDLDVNYSVKILTEQDKIIISGGKRAILTPVEQHYWSSIDSILGYHH